jgi:hypothetical protein
LISFPPGTEMCQFSGLPSAAYVFSDERRRITGVGFPHSEIRGSKAVQRLTAAYRSRPRPSSAPGAKASTVCPYYLDGELHPRPKAQMGRIPFWPIGAVFKLRRGRSAEDFRQHGLSKLSSDRRRLEAAGTGPVDILRKTCRSPSQRGRPSDVSLERR